MSQIDNRFMNMIIIDILNMWVPPFLECYESAMLKYCACWAENDDGCSDEMQDGPNIY